MGNEVYQLYKQSVLKFAKDSKDWHGLNQVNFFTSTYNGEWKEGSDPDAYIFSLDVSWAFKKKITDQEIKQQFNTSVRNQIMSTIEWVEDDPEFYRPIVRGWLDLLD